jgi:hypothetical protein
LVRWRCASALRPSPSRLLPGAANKAQKAKKGEEKRAKRYPAGSSLELVERYVHAAAVARHEDDDGAAVLPIEEAQLASSGCVRRACDGSRRIAGFERSSTHHLRGANAWPGTVGCKEAAALHATASRATASPVGDGSGRQWRSPAVMVVYDPGCY